MNTPARLPLKSVCPGRHEALLAGMKLAVVSSAQSASGNDKLQDHQWFRQMFTVGHANFWLDHGQTSQAGTE